MTHTANTRELTPPLGKRFIIEFCPECELLHRGADSPWHADGCSEPKLEWYVAQIQGSYSQATAKRSRS